MANFVVDSNTVRYHGLVDNSTPADIYSGRQVEVLTQRDTIKQQTLLQRCRQNLRIDKYAVRPSTSLHNSWRSSVPGILATYSLRAQSILPGRRV